MVVACEIFWQHQSLTEQMAGLPRSGLSSEEMQKQLEIVQSKIADLDEQEKEQKALVKKTMKHILTKTSQIWILFFKSMFFPVLSGYVEIYYKTLGFQYGLDDTFMTSVKSVGRVVSIGGNLFWGFMVDRF